METIIYPQIKHLLLPTVKKYIVATKRFERDQLLPIISSRSNTPCNSLHQPHYSSNEYMYTINIPSCDYVHFVFIFLKERALLSWYI